MGCGPGWHFGISLAIDFECLLIDEVIMVGDRRFRRNATANCSSGGGIAA